MKKLTIMTMALSLIALPVMAQNYSDDLDKNNTPSTLEERENEVINSSDSLDMNAVPAQMEDREKQEQVESDFSQTDDAEKKYDPMDEEIDE